MTEPTDPAPAASPEGAPPTLVIIGQNRCPEESGADICNRPAGHDGDHFDWCDRKFWRTIEDLTEDEEPEPGGATSAWEHHHGL
jgi:hypothetical protein